MYRTPVVTVDPCAPNPAAIGRAAALIRRGGLVVFPTETVYGLGANGLDEAACRRIFAAKGRPADNPLILHLPGLAALPALCRELPDLAHTLFEAFSPGPLTLVLKKSALVPAAASGGLDTVAVRIPDHPVALALLRACRLPVAAPSANLSGRPSPTALSHVRGDLDGRVDLFLDGGPCRVGLESTVLSLAGEVPTLLRPGGISLEQLRAAIGEVAVAPSVTAPLAPDAAPAAPGMKYRHYAPQAPLVLLVGPQDRVLAYMRAHLADRRVGILCYEGEQDLFSAATAVEVLGAPGDNEAHAHRLFEALHRLDRAALDCIYAPLPSSEGLGLAVRNRLLKAAAHTVIEV
ncbi:MAG: threonylcarbamoyl-AMP synthase [Clostridiales bacterium]|nr:threonylcarbamoyl-AMP synthase [Clostridiales bacterium]